MNHSRQGLLVALVVAASLTLAGCSFGGSPNGGTDGGGSSGGSSGSSEGTTTESTTDTGLEGYEGMPATFPADIPVIDGDVLFGIDVGTGWSIVVQADDPATAYTTARDKLTGAGFTADIDSPASDGSFGSFSSDEYTVQVTATESVDYGPSVQYLVVING